MKDKEELDKLKERINCSEDSDCNYCPYAVREECLLDLYNLQKIKLRK